MDMTEEPKYLMRFVGFKEDGSGELKPTSPGGIKQHELRMLPYDYSLSMWWEIVDDIPDLEVPEVEPEDSVYEEEDKVRLIMPVEGDPADVDVIHYEGMTVKSLKLFIKQRGGKVDYKWLKADLVREARELEEASRAASESS